jgi:hypothetical protein
MLIAGSAVNSLVGSVYSPANAALVPLLVGRDNLQQANSVSQGTMVLTQIIGPFVGGILVAHVSMVAAIAANAATYLASVVSLLLVQHREPAREHKKLDVRQFIAEFKEGLDAILRMKLMRQLIPVALIANFLFAPFELIRCGPQRCGSCAVRSRIRRQKRKTGLPLPPPQGRQTGQPYAFFHETDNPSLSLLLQHLAQVEHRSNGDEQGSQVVPDENQEVGRVKGSQ